MQIEKPESCVDNAVAIASVFAMFASMVLFKNLGFRDPHALLCLAGFTIFIFNLIFDINYNFAITIRKLASALRVLSRDAEFRREFFARIGIKSTAFSMLVLSVCFSYFLFLGFSRAFVLPHLGFILAVFPYTVLICLFYIAAADLAMDERDDALYHIGVFMIGQSTFKSLRLDRHYLMACVVKMFFAPLMITFAMDDLIWFLSDDFGKTTTPFDYYNQIFRGIYTVDVMFACVGYLSAFKLFRSDIQTVENKAWGWAVCLICYPPFWPTIRDSFLNYDSGYGWQQWLAGSQILSHIWGLIITGLLLLYGWATVSFGSRFSNLTNRGIITNGAYRWFKHPAYLSKNLSWWMITIPFIANDGIASAVRNSILLLMLNGIYYLRARAEEIQLRQDPVYRDYEIWIAHHGVLGRISRLILPTRDGADDAKFRS